MIFFRHVRHKTNDHDREIPLFVRFLDSPHLRADAVQIPPHCADHRVKHPGLKNQPDDPRSQFFEGFEHNFDPAPLSRHSPIELRKGRL